MKGYIGYLLDITGRRLTELKLENSKNEMRALINALPDTILQITNKGKLRQYHSQKIDKTLHNQISEVYLADMFPTDFADKVIDYVKEAIRTRETAIYEYNSIDSQRNIHHYEARFSEKSNDDALVIIRDITDRKNSEESLKQALLSIEKANLEKSKFLSNMSHELRTPLNAILGFSQLIIMEENERDYKGESGAQEILSAGELLLQLINDILDLSKIEAGKTNLNIKGYKLKDILADCKKLIASIPKNRDVIFNDNIDKFPSVEVLTDKVRLTQIVLNLLSNAMKYNKTNGKVALNYKYLDSDFIRLEVIDSGIGLSQGQIAKLFQPFERIGAENTEVEGTGLGLVLSKNLIELMGGQIGVESEQGRGSTFWVDLKLSHADSSQNLLNTAAGQK